MAIARAHVPLLERGQPERAVAVGVGVVADAEVAEVEQTDGRGTGALERHTLEAEVRQHLAPGTWESERGGNAVELQLVALALPVGVVEVLAAAGVIGADQLDVAVGVRTDPHVLPRRRDREAADALDLLCGQALTGRVEVDKAGAGAPTGPARGVGETVRSLAMDGP